MVVNWHSLNSGLPAVSVDDLLVHPRENELVIGTYGRGIYKMDISPLQQLNNNIMIKDLYLFQIKNAMLPKQRDYNSDWFFETAEYPRFIFYVKKEARVKAEIINMDGGIIDTISSWVKRGLNEFSWNMVKESARYIDGAYKTGTELYPAGKYKVRINSGREMVEGYFEIEKN